MTKIKPKTITITRAEGPSHECGKSVVAHSWSEANAFLFRWSISAPEKGGYDKCDFEIVWEDGEGYSGRYDLVHYRKEHPSLGRHVRKFVEYLAGELPTWCVTKKDIERVQAHQASLGKGMRRTAKEWLEKYETEGP